MSLSKKLANLRKKPQRVRERILIVAMAIIAPVLIFVWIATFSAPTAGQGSTTDTIRSAFTQAFGNPYYKNLVEQPSGFGGADKKTQ